MIVGYTVQYLRCTVHFCTKWFEEAFDTPDYSRPVWPPPYSITESARLVSSKRSHSN
jgi:hypothetical protein